LLAAAGVASGFAEGCAHRVVIKSDPPGAEVRFKGKVVGVTPVELRTTLVPFASRTAKVKLAGLRVVTVRLGRDTGPLRLLGEALTGRWGRLAGVAPRREHEVIFVPVHGRSGTWTPEEARKE